MTDIMDSVGECKSCHHFDQPKEDILFCHKKDEILNAEQKDCKDWLDYLGD